MRPARQGRSVVIRPSERGDEPAQIGEALLVDSFHGLAHERVGAGPRSYGQSQTRIGRDGDRHQVAQLHRSPVDRTLHLVDDVLRAGQFPLCQQRRRVLALIAKVPVEAALGHTELLGDGHDAQALRPVAGKALEPGVQPVLPIQSIVHAATIPKGIDNRNGGCEYLHTKRYGGYSDDHRHSMGRSLLDLQGLVEEVERLREVAELVLDQPEMP